MTTGIVTIATFDNEIEAQATRAFLLSQGVEAFLVNDDVGGMLTSLQMTQGVQLVVRAADEKKARDILRSANP